MPDESKQTKYRTSIYLTKEERETLRKKAFEYKTSMNGLIRGLINLLDKLDKKDYAITR